MSGQRATEARDQSKHNYSRHYATNHPRPPGNDPSGMPSTGRVSVAVTLQQLRREFGSRPLHRTPTSLPPTGARRRLTSMRVSGGVLHRAPRRAGRRRHAASGLLPNVGHSAASVHAADYRASRPWCDDGGGRLSGRNPLAPHSAKPPRVGGWLVQQQDMRVTRQALRGCRMPCCWGRGTPGSPLT